MRVLSLVYRDLPDANLFNCQALLIRERMECCRVLLSFDQHAETMSRDRLWHTRTAKRLIEQRFS